MGKQEFFELGNPEDVSDVSRYRSSRGCFVKLTTGAILLLLALILAVGVGLIVHFVEKNVYECSHEDSNKAQVCAPAAETGNGNGSPNTPIPTSGYSVDDLNSRCKDWASTNSAKICPTCPSQTLQCPTTRAPPTTTRSHITTIAPPVMKPSTMKNIRLPRKLSPIQYDIEIKPNMYDQNPSTFTFDGNVRIKIQCNEATNVVVMHGKKLNIDRSSIKFWAEDASEVVKFIELSEDKQRQFLNFKVDKSLVTNKFYYLEMKYSGPLQTDLAGLYLSSYQQNGQTQYLATTQFQPNDARKAFPCFDEPDFKAVFNTTLIRKPGWTSLSNAKLKTSWEWGDGYVADKFYPTKKMSTYLVAFVVCRFAHNDGQTSRGVPYRTWSQPDAKSQAVEALELGTKIISYYEDLFDISFPLQKQDMIAVPDYPLGGMENWGLITYRESAMLYNPNVSSEYRKQRVTEVIAHELSHMWFGDLVTTAWWDDLWLNEGFATYMSYVGSDFSHPDWKMFDQFTINDVFDAFKFDGLRTSHPIYVPVNSPDEIGEIFDEISYSKGGSVIRMMKHFLGADTFNRGLTRYLRSHEYDVARHDDLFDTLQKQLVDDGKSLPYTVKNIMDTWILQMNYPVVKVTRGDNSKLSITQKRFLLNPDSNQEDRFNSSLGYVWKIPFTYTTSTERDFDKQSVHWMSSKTKEIYDPTVPSSNEIDSWVLGNPGQYGFYRVNYDRSNWLALTSQLKQDHTVISVINRAQLINDAWNLARAGETSLDVALQIVEYLDKEKDYVPWTAAKRELKYLDLMLSKSEIYGEFQEFMKSRVEPVYNDIGLDNSKSTHLEILLRSEIMATACNYGVESCKIAAKNMYSQWMKTPHKNPIHPDLQSPVYCTAIAEGGWDEWNFAFERYRESKVASEISLLMSVLACTKQQWILRHYLDLSMDSDMIRSQDTLTVIEQVSSNAAGRLMAWDFTMENWDYFRQKFGGAWNSFSRLVEYNTNSFNTEHEYNLLSEFVRKHPDLGTSNRAFFQAIETTETNIKFMKNNYDVIKSWLHDITSSASSVSEKKNVRLPRSVTPELYEIEIQPNMYNDDVNNFNFTGHVTIHVNCKISTNNITLHANKLNINHNTVKVAETMTRHRRAVDHIRVTGIESDTKLQFVIVHLDANLTPGSHYTLFMEFSGPLTGDLTGLYLSSYKRAGKNVYMATTQMEPTDARKAFPCFDEPDLKAKFKLTIVRKSNLVSLSNMPIERKESRSDGFTADVYQVSRKMSSYLVAYVVCDFNQGLSKKTRNNITYSVWARAESENQLDLALDTGADTITFYEDFFGVKFPLPKQDMIAIPDFAAGAMENWGLITYRENSMLYKEGKSSTHDKQWTTETITHELAHQWFGDLVTMSWWDDLWLNEGFATFVQYLGAHNKHPDWKMFDQFTIMEVQVAFEFDGLISSHPIYTPVNDPAKINEFFDKISYSKGASIIRMMRHFIGEDTFKRGIRNYLRTLQFSNAFHDDLWMAMENQTRIDGHPRHVKSIMDTWTLQMNYPVVKFERLSNGSFTVTQKRYLRNYDAEDPGIFSSKFGYRWKIPLTFTTRKEKQFDQDYRNVHMLESDTATIVVSPPLAQGDWIIGNVQQYGYYRVNYDEETWGALINQLNDDHKAIHTVNRGQLINDAWALAKSGDLTLQIALQTTQYLSKEQDYIPWYAASAELSYVDSMLARTPIYGKFKKYMARVSGGALELLGMDNANSGHIDRLARSTVVGVACGFEVKKCTEKAAQQFASYMKMPGSYMIDPDIKKTVMCAGIAQGGKTEWDFLYNIFKTSNVANERLMIMSALSCSTKTWILRQYLELSLDPEEIKTQDASYVIQYVAGNVIGRELAWEFLQEKWDIYMEKYGKGSFSLAKIIGGVTEPFNTQLDLQQLKSFKELHPNMGTGARAFDQAMEKTAANVAWMDDNYVSIGSWLDEVIFESSGGRKSKRDIRLPRSVLPNHYKLEIKPYMYDDDVDNYNFTGKVTIRVNCKASTNNITLHAKKLSIDQDKVSVKEHMTDSSSGREHGLTRVEYDTEGQLVILHLRDSLIENKEYDIHMEFSGPLKDDMAGFYLSSYKRGNKNVYIATTQMEATDARKAFPCFDDPDLKATFKITLIRKTSLVSLSNMQKERTRVLGDGFVADEYKVSKKMSTYLVAYVFCDFKQGITRVTKNNVTYGAWARPETGNQTQFALDVGARTLDYFEDFFGVPFPLKKEDMIAIPDFFAGGMENWGLITYKEDNMLYQEGVSSSEDKMGVVMTITHELAHQWFGDLVTMKWWDDLWLNEGFARFVQFIGADHLFPEWDIEFSITDVHRAFEFDGHVSSHPIYVPVYNTDEINEIFDAISYSKGGVILRMMRHFVGEDTFRKGVKNYLQSREYANAVHDDLWYAVGNQTATDGHPMDVKGIMDTWTLQMNYPVIKMERLGNGSVLVTQSRYLQNHDAADPGQFTSKYGYVWNIPVTYTTKQESDFDQDGTTVVVMDTVSEVINPRTGPLAQDDWVIGNIRQYGYYRVNYGNSIWRALIQQLNSDHKAIYAVNRGQIINDAWALAKSGDLSLNIALDTTQYLSQEDDFVPWSAADTELVYVDSMLARTPLYGKFQQYMTMIAGGAFSKLGMDNTDAHYLSRRARSVVVSIACRYRVKECEMEAKRLFSKWMTMPDENMIDPDIKSTVLCAGIRNGGVEEWDFLYSRFKQSSFVSEKVMMLYALSCSRTTWILRRYLEISLDPNEIRKQDADKVLAYVSESVIGQTLAWSFLQEKWEIYKERYPSQAFANIIKDVTRRFNTDLELNRLISFKETHPDMGAGTRAFEQAVENAEANIRWMNKNYDVIKAWLNDVTVSTSSSKTLRDVRLPRSLIPEQYDLELFPDIYGPDPNNFTFSGHVKITFMCKESTNNITLHIYKLNVDPSSVKIVRANLRSGTAPTFVKFSEDLARQFLIIHLSGNLIKGTKYYVYMEFSAPLKDDLKGLYLSTYKDGNDTVYMATTHMEPVDARKAFPCFDEPDMKAKFKVTLVRRKSVKSLSNMPIEINQSRQSGLVADVYKISEKMSTYLLAFIVGKFESKTNVTANNVTYGAWSVPQAINQTSLALRTGMETLTFYENFFGTKFPLPKQDMIAIPDFSSGAMENWGLITYRETNMLFKEGISSESNRQRVVEVITHELAHQWFGNLVTMSWWDDLWLNEGFATFVQYLGADHLHPEWKMFEQFTVVELQEAMDFDGLTTSHPLYAKVYNPAQIREIFDSISYSKGAMVIRMVRFFLGNSAFKAGLKTYLSSKAFGNAFHDDLWLSMANQSSLDVKSIMDTWTLQMNYPVVMVTRMHNGKLHLSQKRYLRNPRARDPMKYVSTFGYQWKIPFTYTTSNEHNFDKDHTSVIWFNDKEKSLAAGPTVPENGWVIANLQQTGYYRVNYEEENWRAIVNQLKTDHKAITPSNRAQLINDAWALTKSEDLGTTIALQILEYLKEEMDYVPWSTARQELAYIKTMLSRTSSYGNFEAFIRNLVEKPFSQLGMEVTGSSHLESFAKSTVASIACSYDNSNCLQNSRKLFGEWMSAPENNPITPEMKLTVYCAALKQGGMDEWDFLYNQYKITDVAAEKKTILEALSCTRKTWLLKRYLDFSLTDEIRKQDFDYVMIYVSGNPTGRDMVWNFFQEHWDRIYHDYGQSTFALKNIIKEITTSFNSEFDLLQLQNFKTSHDDLGSGETAMEQALEGTQANIRWMDKNYGTIESWLQTATKSLSTKKKYLKDVKLPRSVIPDLYELEIFPDFYTGSPDNFTFYGYVKIHVHCVEKTSNVTLHINKLTIDESSIRVGSMSNRRVRGPAFVRTSEDKERQFYVLHLDSNLQAGSNYFVEMNFTGPLRDDMAGLYLSTYKSGGRNVYMATTQLEPTDARKAFPCFDEPNLKAKFQITLVRRPNYKSLSNMPQKITGQPRPNGLVADVYQESPVMSTYLVAMIVCNFEKLSGVTKNNITYSAWATPETVNQTAFALDVGVNTITFYEEFFNIKFPLPKQDMIAIPDFSAGAMENWGLITYRETAMLYEPGVSSEANKQRVTTVITHELAHQWFGNLVTMDWWDDLWLNEGFADFIEHFGADHKFPDWNYFAIFAVDELMDAFDFDGLVTSHPMFVPVYNPDQINEVFDTISYAKGASIIRMMRFFVGENNFRQGLHKYLTNRKYRNAEHNDLWFALQNQTATAGNSVPVKDIMDTWTLQMNYPVVSLQRLQNSNVRATQKRFLINPKAKDPKTYVSTFGYVWKVPLTFMTRSNPDFNKTYTDITWLNEKQRDINVTVAHTDWYLANAQLYGYYRVNYDQENWKKLVQQLKDDHTIIHVINRAQLINDAWNLAKAGELDIMTALNTTDYLGKEMEYAPWRTALRELSYVTGMLSRSASFGKFTEQMKSLIEEPFNRVGLNSSGKDTHLQSMLRIELSSYACGFGVDTCVQKAKSLFKNWMADPINSRIDPDIKSAVYCTAIREGGVKEWDFLHRQYQTTNNAAEKIRILNSLSCSKQIWLLSKYLDMSLDSNEVRKQDASYVMIYVSENSIGQDLAWNFVRSHWGTLMEDYGGGSFSFASLIKDVTSNFNTEYDMKQMHQFKENNPDMGTATRAFEQALEKVQSNIDWMKQNYDIIDKWLDSKQAQSSVGRV